MFSFITDGQTLLLILALLYLTECLIWVKKQSIAFVSPWGRRWRVATPISWLGNANGAMLILNPSLHRAASSCRTCCRSRFHRGCLRFHVANIPFRCATRDANRRVHPLFRDHEGRNRRSLPDAQRSEVRQVRDSEASKSTREPDRSGSHCEDVATSYHHPHVDHETV